MAEWSDGRLDEFAVRVDERFDRVEEKTDERFDRVDARFDEVKRGLGHVEGQMVRVNDRLDDLVKAMIAAIVTFTGAVLAGFAAILVLIATQL